MPGFRPTWRSSPYSLGIPPPFSSMKPAPGSSPHDLIPGAVVSPGRQGCARSGRLVSVVHHHDGTA